jgi:hypothetical protein
VLATILAFNHATSEQISFVVGRDVPFVEATLARLWRAGLVEEGYFVKSFSGTNLYPSAAPVFRLGDPSRVSSWLGSMGVERARGAHLGADIGRGPDHLRHNLCATELVCRLGEHHSDVFPLILGENQASMAHNFPNNKVAVKSQARADFVAVRNDGFRVCFEVTNEIRKAGLAAKVSRWANVLKAQRGAAVVFPFIGTLPADGIDGLLAEMTSIKALGVYGDNYAHVAARIAFVAVEDWFPQMGLSTPEWDTLQLRVNSQEGVISTTVADFDATGADPAPLAHTAMVLANPSTGA